MHVIPPLDCAGRRRSPATLSGFHQGGRRGTKGCAIHPTRRPWRRSSSVMRTVGDRPDGSRLRGVIVVLWRAGLRIGEALALQESDLDRTRGAVLVRRGKGGKRREVGMDRWAWEQLDPWLAIRAELPVGALFCVLRGPTRGRPCSPAGIRTLMRNAAVAAGVRRRFAPHQLRHAHVARRGPAGRHPAATGSCRPWDHVLLPARDRQHRNYPRRPRTTSTDDPGHHRSEPRRLTGPVPPTR